MSQTSQRISCQVHYIKIFVILAFMLTNCLQILTGSASWMDFAINTMVKSVFCSLASRVLVVGAEWDSWYLFEENKFTETHEESIQTPPKGLRTSGQDSQAWTHRYRLGIGANQSQFIRKPGRHKIRQKDINGSRRESRGGKMMERDKKAILESEGREAFILEVERANETMVEGIRASNSITLAGNLTGRRA